MSFTFEIDNFSEKEGVILSPNFFSGGCEWYVEVFPKGYIVHDHLSLYLFVANPESLSLGWERRASFSFALLNESGKELFKTKESSCQLFCAEFSGWGRAKAVPLKKLQKFMEKNKLIVRVEVKEVEVVDEGDVTGKETLDIRGFQVLYPQANSVSRLFTEHPDIAKNFKLKNQLVKTTYMNLLLGLIETLNKPPHSFSEDELSTACSELMELAEAGFKVDWLKTKLDEVSLESKKENTRVQELEVHIKNLTLELNKEKVKTDTSDAKVMSLEKTVSDLKVELKREKIKSATCVAKVLSLDQMVSDLQDDLKKQKHVSDSSAAKVMLLEQTVSDLEDELMNKEKHESDASAANGLSLEQIVADLTYEVSDLEDEVSDLKDELNKNEAESAAKVLSLEQTVLSLRAELKKEKAAACSWEVLDYE